MGTEKATPTATLDVTGMALVSGALDLVVALLSAARLELTPTGTATAAAGFDSQMPNLYTSAYKSTSQAELNPGFEWGKILDLDL